MPLVLAVLLGTVAVAKVVGGVPVGVSYSQSLYWGVTLLETATAVLLCWSRYRRLGLFVGVVIAFLGTGHAIVVRPAVCGCVGNWLLMTWRGELILAGLVGCLSIVGLSRKTA